MKSGDCGRPPCSGSVWPGTGNATDSPKPCASRSVDGPEHPNESTVETALLIMFVWAAIGETAFFVFYGVAFPWYRSELGRQMFIYSVTVGALMDLALISRFFPHLIPNRWVWVAAYGVLAAVITWRLAILVRMWWQQRNEEGRHRHP